MESRDMTVCGKLHYIRYFSDQYSLCFDSGLETCVDQRVKII